MSADKLKFTLNIWRQRSIDSPGRFETHVIDEVTPDMSFLEMLDVLNNRLEREGKEPIAFDSDCREGICGACGLQINGRPHGPLKATTTCQLTMRHFTNGETITVEPFRAGPFPLVKDLIVDRSACDRIIQAGGFISVRAGTAREANAIPIPKHNADRAFDAAACIGCGACVASCRNASAMLFAAAKVSHLALLPQGRMERADRVQELVRAMDAEGFGNCSNEAECEAACPKEVSMANITRLNREYIRAGVVRLFSGD